MDKSKNQLQDPLDTYRCPPGYCRCHLVDEGGARQCRFIVDDRNFDDQCVCDREGEEEKGVP